MKAMVFLLAVALSLGIACDNANSPATPDIPATIVAGVVAGLSTATPQPTPTSTAEPTGEPTGDWIIDFEIFLRAAPPDRFTHLIIVPECNEGGLPWNDVLLSKTTYLPSQPTYEVFEVDIQYSLDGKDSAVHPWIYVEENGYLSWTAPPRVAEALIETLPGTQKLEITLHPEKDTKEAYIFYTTGFRESINSVCR